MYSSFHAKSNNALLSDQLGLRQQLDRMAEQLFEIIAAQQPRKPHAKLKHTHVWVKKHR
jgi:hypothetical protein